MSLLKAVELLCDQPGSFMRVDYNRPVVDCDINNLTSKDDPWAVHAVLTEKTLHEVRANFCETDAKVLLHTTSDVWRLRSSANIPIIITVEKEVYDKKGGFIYVGELLYEIDVRLTSYLSL